MCKSEPMDTSLDEQLNSLLNTHIGQDHLRTPLLNRLQSLVDAVAQTTLAQQSLAAGAPLLQSLDHQARAQLQTDTDLFWSDLAPGTVLSRLQHAEALRAEDLMHRAQLLAALGEVTEAGRRLLLDALQPGEDAVLLVCSTITLLASDGTHAMLPGAELIERRGGGRCLLVCPGLEQQLFEFGCATEAGRGLIEYLFSAQGHVLRQRLALQFPANGLSGLSTSLGVRVRFVPHTARVLEHGLRTSIASQVVAQAEAGSPPEYSESGQRSAHFWLPLPKAISAVVATAIRADGERQRALLTFGGITPDIATALLKEKLDACEGGVQGYAGDALDSPEHRHYRQLHGAWQAAQGKTRQLLEALTTEASWPTRAFWAHDRGQGLSRQHSLALELSNALRHDAGLQVCEGTLAQADLERILEVVNQPDAHLRGAEGTVVAELAVGEATYACTLPGAYIIAAASVWVNTEQVVPALLFQTGESGGVRRFASLEQLLQCVTASLRDPTFTALWARFPADTQKRLASLLALEKLPLVTTPVEGDWIDSHLRATIDRYDQAAARMPDDQGRQRLREELASALRQPAHGIRETAIGHIAEQRRLQAVLQALPRWLATAGQTQRNHYAGLLDDYNRLAAGQEAYLQGRPTTIRAFAADLLETRLKADLKQSIDPERLLLRLPDSVEVKAVPNVPSQIQVPSAAHSTISIVELALLNIDRQMTLRLGYAQWVHRDTGAEVSMAGLDIPYLRRLVLELDVARRYRESVQALFTIAAGASARPALHGQIMALPYSAAFRLQAFGAWCQGWLTEQAWQMLERAAQCRSAAAQAALGVSLGAVTLSLGPGQADLPSGLLLIQAPAQDLHCLYLPDVPHGAHFIQATSVQGLRDSLLLRLRSASVRRWLAGQAGVGQPTAARESYIEQAYQRSYGRFIKFSPLADPVWPLATKLLRDHRSKLLDDASLISRSREDVRAAFARQLREGGQQLLMSGLAYLPGIGTLMQLSDGWHDARQAVQAFAGSDPALGLRRLASAELNFGFALLSFLPGMAAAKVARSSLKPRQGLRPSALQVSSQRTRLDGFAGHETSVSLVGARLQRGPDAGTWKQGGKLYLWQDGQAYEVFRRRGELTLRLRRTAANNHEHPVRPGPDGRFVTHLDAGLRAGGRSRAGSSTGATADPSAMGDYLIVPDDRPVMSQVLARGGRYNLDEMAASLQATPGDAARIRFFAQRRQLLQDADAYLEHTPREPRVPLPVLASDVQPAALIAAVYENANGLVVGEAHSSAASKRFLIDNFATLAATGVKTLYFEHLPMDFLADDLKAFNGSGVMTPALKARLQSLDTGHRVDAGQPFTFEQVVVKAHDAGLQVVSLDCAASWYAKGVMDARSTARQRMFSYLATRVIADHQHATGEHKWVALVGNSHANTFKGTPGLAELNKAIGVRVSTPDAGGRPGLRSDPGFETHFNQGMVKADFLLELEVPTQHLRPSAGTGELTASQLALATEMEALLTHTPVGLQPAPPRLIHPGSFYLQKVEGKRQVVHLSRDGNIYHTPVEKTLGRYWLSRPSWDKVHGRRFWTLQGLLAAMAEQNLSLVQP